MNERFDTPGVSRRLMMAGATGALGSAALASTSACTKETGAPGSTTVAAATETRARDAGRTAPFRGPRQAGVVTPQQQTTLVVAYDLNGSREALRTTLARWTDTLTDLVDNGPGETALTATVAIGPGMSRQIHIPNLPPFDGDRLLPNDCGGDLILQLRAHTRASVRRAAAELTGRTAAGTRIRWQQAACLPPTAPGETPRNVLGFKDGSANPTPEECERWVWDSRGGTFVVVRRIHVKVTDFRELSTVRQEEVIGRTRATGVPLGGRRETDDADIFRKTPQGRYVLPLRAHVRAASPRLDGGARMLRRGYSYDNGPDDRGLLFVAFMRDPALFVRVQERLADKDDLSRFTEHRGSAVAYVLPGATADRPLGAGLV